MATEMPAHVCCEEHKQQLYKFADLSQLLPTSIDLSSLALHFARTCQNNKKAARAARRMTTIASRASQFDDKSTSPFHIVDRLLATPTGIYTPELNARPFQESCTRKELLASFQNYVNAFTFKGFDVVPYSFDLQLRYRSISFLSKDEVYNRLILMSNIYLKETRINRFHKGSILNVHTIVEPLITPRAIQTIIEDKNGNLIRMSIYNWYTMLVDQSHEHIRHRFRRGSELIIGQPFIKMGADGLLLLRVDNPRLELWFNDYEQELKQMDPIQLRDLGNKCFRANDIYGAIDYYTLGLSKSPDDTRILNNRAECFLQGHFHRLARVDCEHILDICKKQPTEEYNDISFKWKVHYRQMRALIGLHEFDQAQLSVDPLLDYASDIGPTHNEIVERFRRICDNDIPRLRREAEGHYDMVELLTRRTARPDDFHAEFERHGVCEFRPCEQRDKGFGMFALCALEPGTLLFVERPFAHIRPRTNESLVDDPSQLVTFSLTQKPEHRHPEEGGTHGGKYLRQTILELLQELEIRLLVDDNKRSIQQLSHLTPLRQYLARKKSDDEEDILPYKYLVELYERNMIGNGIWPKLSRFNHSCLPNCHYLLIDRLCFVSVLKPIEIGEEMTVCYMSNVYNSYIERTVRLREFAIEECQCILCLYDRDHGQAEMQQICRLFEESDEDEDKRRLYFKRLIRQYSSQRPLGFIEQMSQLRRQIVVDLFIEQVQHGYLAHSYILNYLASRMDKYPALMSVIEELKREFAYFNWPSSDDWKGTRQMIRLLADILSD